MAAIPTNGDSRLVKEASRWSVICGTMLAVVSSLAPGTLAQSLVIQVPDILPGSRDPVLILDGRDRPWLIAISDSGDVGAGYVEGGVWVPALSARVWSRVDYPYSATLDSVQRVWVMYADSGKVVGYSPPHLHVGYFSGGAWKEADNIVLGRHLVTPALPYYDRSYAFAKGQGIEYCLTLKLSNGDADFQTKHITGMNVLQLVDLGSDRNVSFRGVIQLGSALGIGYDRGDSYVGNNFHWGSHVRLLRETGDYVTEFSNGSYDEGPGVGGAFGDRVSSVVWGSSGQDAVVLIRKTTWNYYFWGPPGNGDPNGSTRYLICRQSGFSITEWDSIPDLVPSGDRAAATQGAGPARLAWTYRDSIRVINLNGHTWSDPLTLSDQAADSSRSVVGIANSGDSSFWITYSGMKSGVKRSFLVHVADRFTYGNAFHR